MSVFEPEAVESLGMTKVVVLAAAANTAAVSLATEIGAVTTIDVSLTIEDWNPQVTPNAGTQRRRLGTKNQFPREGLAQYAGIPISYPYDPQAEDTDPNNKAKATLTEGLVKPFLVRKGVDAEDPLEADDKYELWTCRLGKQILTIAGDGEFAEYVVNQTVYPIKEEVHGEIVA